MDFNPKDKSLWTNDNQVDGMGDEIPPGEMNRIASSGQDFGFPWFRLSLVWWRQDPHQRV
jgi:glucose/arabinose dehydrogenase